MGFFSKKISSDKIAESLTGFFDVSYGSLVAGLKDLFKDRQFIINKEQDKELIIVSILAAIQATITTFKDSSMTKDIIGKFQHDIFNQYFKDKEERNEFKELFFKRCDEYSEILNFENKDLAIQFGQIFCNHFFGKREDENHLSVIMFIGGSFINQVIEIKKFLDEILQKYEII